MHRHFALSVAAIVLLSPPVLAQQEARGQLVRKDAPAGLDRDKASELIQRFVNSKRAAYQSRTATLAKELDGLMCPLPSLAPGDGLPEPQPIEVSVTMPLEPPPPQIGPDDYIDKLDFQLVGQQEFAVDQTTADTLVGLEHGVGFRLMGVVYQLREAICIDVDPRTRKQTRVRYHKRGPRRLVELTSLLGGRLQLIAPGFSVDNARRRLFAGEPGELDAPVVKGFAPTYEGVQCRSVNRSSVPRLVGENTPIQSPKDVSSRQPLHAVALTGFAYQTSGPVRPHMFTGQGASSFNNSTQVPLFPKVADRDGEHIRAGRSRFRLGPHALAMDVRQGGPFSLGFARNTVRAGDPVGLGSAVVAVRPSGSTAGADVQEITFTANIAQLDVTDVDGFIDDNLREPVVALRGPVPGGSGLRVNWSFVPNQGARQRGTIPLPAGGNEIVIPLRRPSVQDTIAARGIRGVLAVDIGTPSGGPMYEETAQLLFRPPPVENIHLVGRRDGSEKGLRDGPFDLFRVPQAKGIEVQIRPILRGGISGGDYTPARLSAFGMQQSTTGGLQFDGSARSAVISASTSSSVPRSRTAAFLRSSAAKFGGFSPPAEKDVVVGTPADFTMNDVLLVIENLGANGFIWRLIVDGEADMSRYSASFNAPGSGQGRQFQRDGKSTWVAERHYPANAAAVDVTLHNADGEEIARLRQNSPRTIAPGVRLDVPEVYKQGVPHPLSATVFGLRDMNPTELVCAWELERGYGNLAFASTALAPVDGDGASQATCQNEVTMTVDEATLGRYPNVTVTLKLLPKEFR